MKIVLAPPGSGKSKIAQLVANCFDGDSLLPVNDVYSYVTTVFGPSWYFIPEATAWKDQLMAPVRTAIERYVMPNQILLTAESGLATQKDQVAIVVPSAEYLITATRGRTGPCFKYPSLEVTERIRQYYIDLAETLNIEVDDDISAAVVRLLNP